MSLREYRTKRDFAKTKEPHGNTRAANKKSPHGQIFTVQKHAARRLHFDFRLEWNGVLKSWAVPKGPSLDPRQKRLAVQVEDHPLDYARFEGEIPKGEYGAGQVIVWDYGFWKPVGSPATGLRKGKLEFELYGEKLHGRWLLIRLKKAGKGEKQNWFLIKRSDQWADSSARFEITDQHPESVLSGLEIEEVTASLKKKSKPKKKTKLNASKYKRRTLPATIAPQLARLIKVPPRGAQWVHEIKFDGYRTFCRIENGQIRLLTRTGLDWTHRYPHLEKECQKIPVQSALLDGEVVAASKDQSSSFSALQEALEEERTENLIYYVFDLIFLDGENLSQLPLLDRKERLRKIIDQTNSHNIRYSEHWQEDGPSLLKASCNLRLEGIVSKKAQGPYEPGRGHDWLKSKCKQVQEFLIGGYTTLKESRAGLGALLLGAYNSTGELVYLGKVGTGFNQVNLPKLKKGLNARKIEKSPFQHKSPKAHGITWVKPEMVAQVEFSEWTNDGNLRHSSFQGLREDKKPEDVVLDDVKTPESESPMSTKSAQRWHGVKLTHPQRILYSQTGVTKARIADYYDRIKDSILPHLVNRPLALLRCPEGEGQECFFQKHLGTIKGRALKQVTIHSKDRNEDESILYVNSIAGIIELVQMGTLEIHVWGCHKNKIDRPDQIVFDLDPGPGISWSEVVHSAFDLRELLLRLDLKSFAKVTGGKGVHVHVPVQPRYSWEDIKSFAKTVSTKMAQENAQKLTTHISKSKRKGKIFLDYLRNGYGATAVCAYSLRAKLNAPVALPLSWRELKKVPSSDAFSLQEVEKILKRRKKDPWADYFELNQKIKILNSVNK